MNAVNAILPVVFMLFLGALSRKTHIISDEQNAGIKKLIFSLLLPILVFNATFTMSVDPKYLQLTGYTFLLQCLTLAAGFLLCRFLRTDYAHISPYLMTTIEGGNAFYPLYISLVGTGYASYFILLDLPGIFMIFLIIPLLLARNTAGSTSAGTMLRDVCTNPIICALTAGILLNVTGLADLFLSTAAGPAYEALVSVATTPIAPLILFTLGHSFMIGRENLLPIIKTTLLRLILMGAGVAIAFALFPWILADEPLAIAVTLFLAAPPAFAMPIILEKEFRHERDSRFCSTCISVHMLATVIVFALVALFTA